MKRDPSAKRLRRERKRSRTTAGGRERRVFLASRCDEKLVRRSLWDSTDAIAALERALREMGLKPETGSPLETAFYSLETLRGGVREIEQIRSLSHAIGICSLVDRLAPALNRGFKNLAKPHLALLCHAGVSGAQNTASVDDATRKLFELVVGMMAFDCAADIELEDPDSGKPSLNPDVLFTYRGTRWGIACKMLSSKNPLTLMERIVEGAKQIAKSPAERGLVFINPCPVMPYDKFQSHRDSSGTLVHRAFDDPREALEIVNEFQQDLWTNAQREYGLEGMREALSKLGPDGHAVAIADVPAIVFYNEISITVNAPDGRRAWQHAFAFQRAALLEATIDNGTSMLIDSLRNALKARMVGARGRRRSLP